MSLTSQDVEDLQCLLVTLRESLVWIYVQARPADAVQLCDHAEAMVKKLLTRMDDLESSAAGTRNWIDDGS